MKIVISAESTIDLPKEILEEYGIKTIPFSILLGEKLMLDGDMQPTEIFEYVDASKVLPKTSAVNEYQYTEYFKELLTNADAVIHFSLSKELSCTYNNAKEASANLENVYVINSKSLSTGIALLAIKASNLSKEGKTAQEIVEIINKDVDKVQASFVLEKLDYLRKGGRCSAIVAFGANILKIHPQILVTNGKMSPAKKYRGNYDVCVKQYCKDTLEQFSNADKSLAFVTYTTASDEAVLSAETALKEAGFKKILKTRAGATISSHCGPNTLGILFLTV